MKIIYKKYDESNFFDFYELSNESEDYAKLIADTLGYIEKYKEYRDNCYVAYHKDKLVGFIYGCVLCDTLYPQFLYVKKDYRKKGIGKKLMNKLEQGVKDVEVIIYYHNTLSDFYKKQGYEVSKELEVAIKHIGGNSNEAKV